MLLETQPERSIKALLVIAYIQTSLLINACTFCCHPSINPVGTTEDTKYFVKVIVYLIEHAHTCMHALLSSMNVSIGHQCVFYSINIV